MGARFFSWVLALTIAMTVLAVPVLADGKRVALVIGNAAYKHAAELRNPRNDAQDVADALDKLGFTVIPGYDLDHSGLRRSIGSFAVALENATVAVFYYAGHGIQVGGTNYMVPIDSRLENEYSPEFELIRMDVVQRLMESRPRTNIIFLDSCRDNPLARNLARAMGTRSTSVGRGLSPTESGIGTLVSYSTQPGNVAVDGVGRNSPYAEALVRQLKREGIAITDMLLDVRRDVMHATNDRQIPWEHSALRDRFYFAPAKPAALPPPLAATRPDEELAKLARQLNRELRRVGCDPHATDGTWTAASQAALQRFAEITKLALHTDEPTQAALDAVSSHKFVVCPLPTKAPAADKPLQSPIAAKPSPTIIPLVTDTAPVAAKPPTAAPSAVDPPPTAAVVPIVAPPPASAASPSKVTLPEAEKPSVVTKPPAPASRASVAKPQPTAPPPAAVSSRREKTCRTETRAECQRRQGMTDSSPNSFYVCGPIATRKEVCQ